MDCGIYDLRVAFALFVVSEYDNTPSQLFVIEEMRWPWCNGYHRRKWTRQHEFKSWTRLIAFHIALIPLGKV